MKVLVAVKRVVDFNVKIRVKSDKTGVDNKTKAGRAQNRRVVLIVMS